MIDGAINCVYDTFAVTEKEFRLIFAPRTDVAFIDEVLERNNPAKLDSAFGRIWTRRVCRADANGIHGMLFYELETKKKYYPTRRDEEATGPGGALPRGR